MVRYRVKEGFGLFAIFNNKQEAKAYEFIALSLVLWRDQYHEEELRFGPPS
jgi:hypothetical protein